jgi:hypothetical protein
MLISNNTSVDVGRDVKDAKILNFTLTQKKIDSGLVQIGTPSQTFSIDFDTWVDIFINNFSNICSSNQLEKQTRYLFSF